MKLLVVAALIAAMNFASSMRYDLSETETGGASYLQYLKNRRKIEEFRAQFEKLCSNQSDKLDDVLQQVQECNAAIPEDTETACSTIKKYFLKCGNPLIQLLEECFPENAKGVPTTIFQSINSGVNFLCKTDGEHIFELANTCLFKTNYRTMRCERRVKAKLQQYKNKPPSKSELCEVANSMKPCLQNHLADACGNHITREAFMGIFDAFTAPCKGTQSQLEGNTIYNEVELF